MWSKIPSNTTLYNLSGVKAKESGKKSEDLRFFSYTVKALIIIYAKCEAMNKLEFFRKITILRDYTVFQKNDFDSGINFNN